MAEPDSGQEPIFTLEKIYLKDASYESPGSPQAFLEQQPGDVQMQLAVRHTRFESGEGFYEVVLAVTVVAKKQDKTVFLIEVQQAGVFRIQGIPAELLERVLEINCPTVLLPFAREAVSDLTGKGGFPPLLISPVNFESLYEQKRAGKQAASPQAGGKA